MTRGARVEVEQLSPALGARVTAIDLRALGVDDRVGLRAAMRRYHLLAFPSQDLDDDEHVALASVFGPVAEEGFGDGRRPVGFVSNVRPDGTLGSTAASFHIDFGFFPHPYEVISLAAVEVPPGGTETWFVNAVAAARTLAPGLRARVEGRTARHAIDLACPAGQSVVRVRAGRLTDDHVHAVRPVLWAHHDTGEEILAVCEQHTDAIVGLEPEASTALVEDLFAHLYRPEHRLVHRWAPGDVIVWDNHALQHGRPDVGVDAPRTLRRVCVGATQDLSVFAAARAAAGEEAP
jgi:taurine dioxygenase